MTYTQVVHTKPTLTGTTLTYTAAEAAGTAIRPGTLLHVKNGSGSPITLTINVGRTYNGYVITSPTVAVAAGAEVVVGPFPADPFVQTTGVDTGWIRIDYSAVTSVTRLILGTS